VHHAIPFVLFGALAIGAALAVRRASAAPLLATAWAIPLIAANFAVNPLVRSSDLAREGEGHRVVTEALRATPGRLVHYGTHGGTYPNAFGWPLLVGVEQSPDVNLFRFLAPETPGLTEEVFNRYAHVVATLPPEPALLLQDDAFRVPIDPCSRRVATLGVNHFLLHPEYAARVPEVCACEFSVRRAGDLVLWTRRAPVGELGIARTPAPRSALDFDFGSGAAPGARVTLRRDGLTVDVLRDVQRPVALAVNRSLVDVVRCAAGAASALDAHVVVWPAPGRGASCRVDYLGTVGALRRLARTGERPSR
jgi:hypothetical protein